MNAGKKSPVVRQLAVSLTKGLIQKDWNSEVNTLYKFVRDRIRYVRDINGVETLHTPEKILENAAGDCDDKSVLLASLLESLGYKTRLVAVGFRKNSFSHVYPEVLHNNNWVSLETTEPVNMGWKPKNIVTSLILNTTSIPVNIFNGLSGKKKINRKDIAQQKLVAELEAARVVADSEKATDEDITHYNNLIKQYEASIESYKSAEIRKGKTFVGKLKALKVKELKLLAKLKVPTFRTHYQHEMRLQRAKDIKLEIMKLQGLPPSDERDAKLNSLSVELQSIGRTEKKYMKDGKIVAVIVSIVIGFFTFGGGSAAVTGAYEALKQGAVALAKSILIGAVGKGIAKGGSKADAAKSTEIANDIERYPPDPSLPSLNAMIEDSQRKKLAAQEKTTAILIPAGIVAALTLFS